MIMKKLAILVLFSIMYLATYAHEKGKDHPIVGKWEYVKTILPDGSEVIDLIATEHFYSDGTLLFVNIWLNPIPVDKYSGTPEEIKNNQKSTIGGIGTYTMEKGDLKDKLTYKIVSSTKMKDMGQSNSVAIEVDKDTLIYYFNNGNRLIMKRVINN